MADERMNLNDVPVPEVEDDNHPENAGDATRIHHMRSTLATTVKCLGAVREKLTKEHLQTMKKTPFYLLLLVIYKDQLTTSQCRKMDNNIVSVVQLFNSRTRSVKLGMEEVGFSITDVKYIFGIVDGKREIVVSKGGKKKTAFVERLFPKGQKLEQKLLKERLDELVQKREHVDIEDTVRILCLILISSLFFCSTGLRIPWGWVDFVENLDEMKSYDWCGKILSTLLDSMTAKKEKPSKINGCTLFLLYWLCEHATIVTPKPRNPTMTVPRVLKWNLPDLWTKVTKDRLMNLTRDQVEIGGPSATLREMLLFRNLENSYCQLGGYEELNLQTTNDNANESMIERQKPKDNDKENDKKVENEIKNLREEILRLSDAKDSALLELHNAKLQNETLKKELSTLEKEKSFVEQKMQQQTDSLQAEMTWLRTEKASFEKKIEKQTEIIKDLEVQIANRQATPLKMVPKTVIYKGEEIEVGDMMTNLSDREEQCGALMSRVRELEAERWRDEENLALKFAELSELKNNYNVLKQENADMKAHVLEQEEKNANLVSELMDVLAEQAAHAVTQGGNQVKIQEKGDGKTPNSMYKKLKDRKRKQLQDDDFEYGPQRKAAPRSTKGAPAQSKKNEAFLKSLDRRQRNNCARLLSSECIDKILSVKTKDLGETVYCSDSGKTIVAVKDIFNIFLGNFVDNFVVDAYGMELLGHTSTTSKIVNSNCWSFVKKNMDDAAFIYKDFVEAQKTGARYLFFPMNSTGPSPGGEPYHWTLLVWDYVAEEWSHYNSLKPRQPAGIDPWFDDAIFLKNKIESNTKPPPDYGLTTQDISVAIHNVAEVPQQAPNMNECALYVCYFMTQLVRGLPIDANIDCQTFRKFKAHVVESIITRKWLQ